MPEPSATASQTAPEPETGTPTPAKPSSGSGRGARMVSAGILASRVVGLLRQTTFAHYFGNSAPAAAFNAALRIPNFLQNLFGEGILSASFIPVYARLLGEKKDEDADRVANAVFGLLALAVAVLVLGGELFTPALVDLIAGGFKPEVRELTIRLVRVIFPGTGLLVLSAWCLGILNSHRRFFLSYAAPIAWSVAQIAALLAFGRGAELPRLAEYLAWATVAGSALQFAVQLPVVLRLVHRFRPRVSLQEESTRAVLRGFGPVVVGRGVVQVSAYVDTYYASLISEVAFSALNYAQQLALLPISLFGMAVSASELVEMSRALGEGGDVAAALRAKIDAGLARIAFYVVPSAAAFLLIGDALAAPLFQSGRFGPADTRLVWYLLMGSAVGLVASTFGRLYSSSFYALKDTRTPLYTATARVVLTAALAYWSAVKLPEQLGVPRVIGGVGITATTGVAAWVEYLLLRHLLTRRIGRTGLQPRKAATCYGAALAAGGAALAVKLALLRAFGPALGAEVWGGAVLPAPAVSRFLFSAALIGTFGAVYLGLQLALGDPEVRALAAKVGRRLGRR